MSKDEKLTVDITNRPSDKNQHSGMEWRQHLGLRESADTLPLTLDHRLRSYPTNVTGQGTERSPVNYHVTHQFLTTIGTPDLSRIFVTKNRFSDKPHAELPQTFPRTANLVEEPVQAVPQSESENDTQATAQIELLRALLKMMDPAVVKKALGG